MENEFSFDNKLMITTTNKKIQDEMNLLFNKRLRDSTEFKENKFEIFEGNEQNKTKEKILRSKLSAFKLKKALFESPFLNLSISGSKLSNELTNKRINNFKLNNGKTIKLNLLNILDCIENDNIDINEEKTNALFDFKENKENLNTNLTNDNFCKDILNLEENKLEHILNLKNKIIFQEKTLIKDNNEYDSVKAQKPFSTKEIKTDNNLKIDLFHNKNNIRILSKFDPKKQEKLISKLNEENKNLNINQMLDYIFENRPTGNKSKQNKEFEKNINQDSKGLENKIIINENENTNGDIRLQKRSIFCTCKKTNCSKYYCFCLKNGLECGESCVCNDCDNKCKKRFTRNLNENQIEFNNNNVNQIVDPIEEKPNKDSERTSDYKFSFDT